MKYSDLRVWQEAMDLVTEIYQMTKLFPSEEKFGLASQLQRAAVSVPSNIAEGHGRKSTNAYLNHLSIPFGSLMEIETQIQIAARLKYITEVDVTRLLARTNHVGKMLSSLKNSLSKHVD
jgi:four helix bundle protein